MKKTGASGLPTNHIKRDDMREIKFRGVEKDKSYKRTNWVYGLLTNDIFGDYYIEFYEKGDTGQDKIQQIKVIPETVGQLAGLPDINDKEIYEGDVIKTSWEGNKEVVFRKGCFCYQTGGDKYHIFNEKKVEVIGNIYENKDLLKAELSEGELI